MITNLTDYHTLRLCYANSVLSTLTKEDGIDNEDDFEFESNDDDMPSTENQEEEEGKVIDNNVFKIVAVS